MPGKIDITDICCVICQLVPLEVLQTYPCEHIGCKYCFDIWFANHEKCPLCRTKVASPIKKPRILANIINSCEAKCKHEDCHKIVKISKLSAHENACDFEITKCPRYQCNTRVFRKNLETHILECTGNIYPSLYYVCQKCRADIHEGLLPIHCRKTACIDPCNKAEK